MEIKGVTEFLAPKSAAWRTPPRREVGMDNARILTYSCAASNSPGEDAASGPILLIVSDERIGIKKVVVV